MIATDLYRPFPAAGGEADMKKLKERIYMQYCRGCKVNVDGKKSRCPLCQGELTGEQEEEMYPAFAPPRFGNAFIVKLISFIAVAAGIICLVTDFLLNEGLGWSILSAGGIFCAWLTTTVAVTYRKRVLKNITWQLFLITALSVIWDRFTGWHGWSLDFVLPCACVCATGSILLLAKILKMKTGQYLLYMIIGGVYGLLPLGCIIAGLVNVKAPSVICSGVSAIVIAALLIFRGKSTKAEMERRLHL
ncbi:MAG: DUF6320 domain-containing protein [Ruminococcus sp.]|nr:DUF6320 domain-containing protein [Ruminococcus sp.]